MDKRFIGAIVGAVGSVLFVLVLLAQAQIEENKTIQRMRTPEKSIVQIGGCKFVEIRNWESDSRGHGNWVYSYAPYGACNP